MPALKASLPCSQIPLEAQPKVGAWAVLGAPGSGLRAQIKALSLRYDLSILPARDLLLTAALDLKAKRLKGYLDAGAPVPPDMALSVLLPYLSLDAFAHGFVLDGYPQSQEQARALDLWLAAKGRQPTEAIYLDTPFDTLLRRLSGRRYCRHCPEACYNVFSSPSKLADRCERCGEALYQRFRDRPEEVSSLLIKARYRDRDLAAYYEAKGCLRRADAAHVLQAA